eukprot:UN1600
MELATTTAAHPAKLAHIWKTAVFCFASSVYCFASSNCSLMRASVSLCSSGFKSFTWATARATFLASSSLMSPMADSHAIWTKMSSTALVSCVLTVHTLEIRPLQFLLNSTRTCFLKFSSSPSSYLSLLVPTRAILCHLSLLENDKSKSWATSLDPISTRQGFEESNKTPSTSPPALSNVIPVLRRETQNGTSLSPAPGMSKSTKS